MPPAIKQAAVTARRVLARKTDITVSELLAFLVLYAAIYAIAVALVARASANAISLD
jgi:hypothetical protein